MADQARQDFRDSADDDDSLRMKTPAGVELLEVVSIDEKQTTATQPLTPMPSHSWSLSSNSIMVNTYSDDNDGGGNDQEQSHPEQESTHNDTASMQHIRSKAILSYSSDSSGLFSPLYEVTSEHTNVFQSTRKPLPRPGKTPRFGNLTYKRQSTQITSHSMETERTSNALHSFDAPPQDVLSFDFSTTEPAPRSPNSLSPVLLCSSSLDFTDAEKKIPKSSFISPVRTFEAFMRGEWQLDRVSSTTSNSSSTEAVIPDFSREDGDERDDQNRSDEVDENREQCFNSENARQERDFDAANLEEEDDMRLDAIIEVKNSKDVHGKDIIVISEINPETLQEKTSTCSQGRFGVDLQELRHQDNKPIIDLTCCTDSEALSFKMPNQTKYERILSAQRQLSFCATPQSFVYSLLLETSRQCQWDRTERMGQLGSSKHPLLVLSEHFRERNPSFFERNFPKELLTPCREIQIPEDMLQNFNERFRGWLLQRSRNGMTLVYQHSEEKLLNSAGSALAIASPRITDASCKDFSPNKALQPPRTDEAEHIAEASSDFDSEVINDTELRAVMKITNHGEDVSIIFPSVSFDTIAEEDSDDGLGHEMDALLELQTQLQSAMDVASALTPSRFPTELTSPFAENLYSKDSSMASFGDVENVDSKGESPCKRGTRRSPRRKVQFNDDVQEFLYVSEICDEPRTRRPYRKRSIVGEFIGICEDVAEELSYSCVALSGLCRVRSRKSPNPSGANKQNNDT